MKTLFFALAFLLGMAAPAFAQPFNITNNAYCAVSVKQYCYNASCNLISTTTIAVAPLGGTASLPACVAPGNRCVFEVCWVPRDCVPVTPCVFIDGVILAPPACKVGTFTGIIQGCSNCGKAPNNQATVSLDPATRNLTITP